MERDANQIEDEGAVSVLEELEAGMAGRPDGRGSKLSKLSKLQLFVPFKAVLTLEETRFKRLKKGQDVSRSRLVCEAIELLSEREAAAKAAGKDEEGAGR